MTDFQAWLESHDACAGARECASAAAAAAAADSRLRFLAECAVLVRQHIPFPGCPGGAA